MAKHLLVDGDILLYKYGFGAQETYKFETESVTVVPEMSEVTPLIREFLTNMLTVTRSSDMLVCFTAPNCFRYDLLSTYKHNRKDNAKPILYYQIKEHLLETYPSKVKERLEADDVMGIMATRSPGKYIVCSIDKDLQQIPGWHFNWKKDAVPRLVSKEDADLWFWKQCLTGDSTDGFSGVPGIGPKTADKVLETVTDGEYWPAILERYLLKGLDESYALTQARMARILRACDYDFENSEPKLWSP